MENIWLKGLLLKARNADSVICDDFSIQLVGDYAYAVPADHSNFCEVLELYVEEDNVAV